MANTKVMIAEDQYIVAYKLKCSLEKLGYSIVSAETAEETISLIEESQPDVILMDVFLRGKMDGIETAKKIKQFCSAPLIFLSAHSDPEILEKAKAVEPFGYLIKPLDTRTIHTTIEIAIAKSKTEKKLRESETFFRIFADSTYDWESWVGKDGNPIYISPSCKNITGYTRDRFLENPVFLKKIIHPDDREKYNKHLRLYTDKNPTAMLDFRITTAEGEERWISHYCQPVYNVEGEWLGRRTCNRDITYRKQVEQEKEKLIETLQNAIHEVKTMRGLLPICAACKKIRNDNGYWEQIEQYIGARAAVEFSHSICPECRKKIYPPLENQMKCL